MDAFDLLQKHPEINILKTSSLYSTKPVGFEAQDWFINAVVLCETSLEPEPLLDFVLGLETNFGRVRTIRWGPRTLDLDILYYGNRQIDLPRLKIPHPLLHERLFVLAPLAEIAPDWVHPVLGLSAGRMLERLTQSDHRQEIQKLEI